MSLMSTPDSRALYDMKKKFLPQTTSYDLNYFKSIKFLWLRFSNLSDKKAFSISCYQFNKRHKLNETSNFTPLHISDPVDRIEHYRKVSFLEWVIEEKKKGNIDGYDHFHSEAGSQYVIRQRQNGEGGVKMRIFYSRLGTPDDFKDKGVINLDSTGEAMMPQLTYQMRFPSQLIKVPANDGSDCFMIAGINEFLDPKEILYSSEDDVEKFKQMRRAELASTVERAKSPEIEREDVVERAENEANAMNLNMSVDTEAVAPGISTPKGDISASSLDHFLESEDEEMKEGETPKSQRRKRERNEEALNISVTIGAKEKKIIRSEKNVNEANKNSYAEVTKRGEKGEKEKNPNRRSRRPRGYDEEIIKVDKPKAGGKPKEDGNRGTRGKGRTAPQGPRQGLTIATN